MCTQKVEIRYEHALTPFQQTALAPRGGFRVEKRLAKNKILRAAFYASTILNSRKGMSKLAGKYRWVRKQKDSPEFVEFPIKKGILKN